MILKTKPPSELPVSFTKDSKEKSKTSGLSEVMMVTQQWTVYV